MSRPRPRPDTFQITKYILCSCSSTCLLPIISSLLFHRSHMYMCRRYITQPPRPRRLPRLGSSMQSYNPPERDQHWTYQLISFQFSPRYDEGKPQIPSATTLQVIQVRIDPYISRSPYLQKKNYVHPHLSPALLPPSLGAPLKQVGLVGT